MLTESIETQEVVSTAIQGGIVFKLSFRINYKTLYYFNIPEPTIPKRSCSPNRVGVKGESTGYNSGGSGGILSGILVFTTC